MSVIDPCPPRRTNVENRQTRRATSPEHNVPTTGFARAVTVAMFAGAMLAGAVACASNSTGAASATIVPPTSKPSIAPGRSLPGPSTITISIDDPALGRLTFDAIAAGDPAGASNGKLVLLLHGFPETGAGYREMADSLAAEGYYAVAPNQRGYSPKARPAETSAYTVDKLAGDVLRMATALGADKFHVVGHDWGGAVSWATAVIGAPRVSSATSLSTPHPDAMADAYANPNGEQAKMSGYMSVFRQPGYEKQLLADGPDGYVRFITAGGMPEATAREYAKVLGDESAMKAALDWYRANPLPLPPGSALGPSTVPSLFVWGATDRFLGRTAAEATAAHVSGSYRFVEVPGGDHWLPEKHTPAVLAALIPHLATHP